MGKPLNTVTFKSFISKSCIFATEFNSYNFILNLELQFYSYLNREQADLI